MKTFSNLVFSIYSILFSQSFLSCFLNLFYLVFSILSILFSQSFLSCLLNLFNLVFSILSILFSQSSQSCFLNLFNLFSISPLNLNLKYNHSLVCLYIVVNVSSVYIFVRRWFTLIYYIFQIDVDWRRLIGLIGLMKTFFNLVFSILSSQSCFFNLVFSILSSQSFLTIFLILFSQSFSISSLNLNR